MEGQAGAIVARDLCTRLFRMYMISLEQAMGGHRQYLPAPGSHSTKSTSPGMEDKFGGGDGPRHPPDYQEKLLQARLEQPDAAFGLGKPKFV